MMGHDGPTFCCGARRIHPCLDGGQIMSLPEQHVRHLSNRVWSSFKRR
jgi:hypothetical protein